MGLKHFIHRLGEKIQELSAEPMPPEVMKQAGDRQPAQVPKMQAVKLPLNSPAPAPESPTQTGGGEPRPKKTQAKKTPVMEVPLTGPTPAPERPAPAEPVVPDNSGRVQWKVRDVQQLMCHIELLLRFQGFVKLPLQSETPGVEGGEAENEKSSPLQRVESEALNDLAEQFNEIVGAGPTGNHLVIVLSTSLTREQLQAVGKQMSEIETQPLLIGDRGAIRYVSQHLETIMQDCDEVTFCINAQDMTPERRMGLQVIQNVLARALNRPVNLNSLYSECLARKSEKGPIEAEVVQTPQTGERLLGNPRSRQFGYYPSR